MSKNDNMKKSPHEILEEVEKQRAEIEQLQKDMHNLKKMMNLRHRCGGIPDGNFETSKI